MFNVKCPNLMSMSCYIGNFQHSNKTNGVTKSTQNFSHGFTATHRFCRRCCNSRVARLTRFLSGCPRASASRAMWTRAVSFLRLSSKRYRDGWLWLICRANALFQASVSLFVRWVLETVALNWTRRDVDERFHSIVVADPRPNTTRRRRTYE